MAFIKWTDDLALGLTTIDTQHQQLVALINRLHGAMTEGKGNVFLRKILGDLEQYAQFHFKTEEELFAEHDYVEIASHTREHDVFRQRVEEFRVRFEHGGVGVSTHLMTFLKNWLIGHIQGKDKRYVPFLQGRGVR